MSDPAAEFFAELARRAHEPRLARFTGTVRFDLTGDGDDEHWYLTITKGDLAISHDDGPADAVIGGEKSVMQGVLGGTTNPVAATLRGVLTVEGDWDLIFLCQRLFGGPRVETGAGTS